VIEEFDPSNFSVIIRSIPKNLSTDFNILSSEVDPGDQGGGIFLDTLTF